MSNDLIGNCEDTDQSVSLFGKTCKQVCFIPSSPNLATFTFERAMKLLQQENNVGLVTQNALILFCLVQLKMNNIFEYISQEREWSWYLHPSLYRYATANLTRASMLPSSAALKNNSDHYIIFHTLNKVPFSR